MEIRNFPDYFPDDSRGMTDISKELVYSPNDV
jgi:hypothetical protein